MSGHEMMDAGRFRLEDVLPPRMQFYICKTFGGIANRTAFQPTFRRILPSGASFFAPPSSLAKIRARNDVLSRNRRFRP